MDGNGVAVIVGLGGTLEGENLGTSMDGSWSWSWVGQVTIRAGQKEQRLPRNDTVPLH